jgi:alpha-L-fucosidase 2
MAEMLVQSHTEEIQYLPAIPSKWKNGYVRGLRIRGNQEIEIEWKDGNIVKAEKRP